jgi:hypothetical protein
LAGTFLFKADTPKMAKRSYQPAYFTIAVFILCAGILTSAFLSAGHSRSSTPLTPWTAVGGCGSSAGAGTDAGIKWIGNGVSGALIDCELVLSQTIASDSSLIRGWDFDGRVRYQTTSALLSLYYHPPKLMDIKLSMPFVYKESFYVKSGWAYTGPFGDMSLDLSRKWGTTGSISTGLTLGFPTGYASIPNYPYKSDGSITLPGYGQPGSGLFTSSLRASYTFDRDWGIINTGCSYSAGLFAVRTTEYGYPGPDPANPKLTSEKKEFEVARDGFGARNDAGIVTPDYFGLFTDVGIKTEGFTHGFSVIFSYPIAPGKYEERGTGTTMQGFATKDEAQRYLDTAQDLVDENGNPIPVSTKKFVLLPGNADNTWYYLTKNQQQSRTLPSISLQYSIEKSDMIFPILVGAIVKMEYENRLLFSGFSVGVGVKFPVY